MIYRDGMVGTADRAASTNDLQPPMQMFIVVVFAVHLCAKHSLVSLQDYVWHTPPSLLQQFLQRDCNARYSLINEAFVPKKKLHYSVS